MEGTCPSGAGYLRAFQMMLKASIGATKSQPRSQLTVTGV